MTRLTTALERGCGKFREAGWDSQQKVRVLIALSVRAIREVAVDEEINQGVVLIWRMTRAELQRMTALGPGYCIGKSEGVVDERCRTLNAEAHTQTGER